MKIRILGLMAGVFWAVSGAYSQNLNKQVTHQQLVWYGYHNTLSWNTGWSLTSEIEERRFMDPDRQHQFLARSQVRYALGESWGASVGFAYFLQSPHDPNSQNKLIIPELRPHLQLDNKQQLDRLIITHRYRAEKRFFRNTLNGELTEGYNSNYRFRYRIALEYPVLMIGKQPVKLKVNDEIMLNAGKRIANNSFDQNRIYGGLSYPFHKNLTIEAGYLKWFQQRASGYQYYNRDIIRLIVSHKIDLKNRKAEEQE